MNRNFQKNSVKIIYAIIQPTEYIPGNSKITYRGIHPNMLYSFPKVCEREGAGISGLIVVMMSHGEQGSILDCDGNPVPIQDIINQMNPAFLDGKPKVCIIYIQQYYLWS